MNINYRPGDFAAIAYTSDGRQVVAVKDENDEGHSCITIGIRLNSTFAKMTIGPLPEAALDALIESFNDAAATSFVTQLEEQYGDLLHGDEPKH